jgi:hypothetical protein
MVGVDYGSLYSRNGCEPIPPVRQAAQRRARCKAAKKSTGHPGRIMDKIKARSLRGIRGLGLSVASHGICQSTHHLSGKLKFENVESVTDLVAAHATLVRLIG